MKNIFLIFLFYLGSIFSTDAQMARSRSVEQFDTLGVKGWQILLRTPYDKPTILNPSNIQKLKKFEVLRVELFYTKFQRSEKFNQNLLNQKRWKELERLLPGITKEDGIAYLETGQTAVPNLEAGRKMFHGFLVSYRPGSDSAAFSTDIAKLKAFLDMLEKPKKSVDGHEAINPITKPGPSKPKPTKVGPTKPTQFKGGESKLKTYLKGILLSSPPPPGCKCQGQVNLKFTIDTLGKLKYSKIASGIGNPCDEIALKCLQNMPDWEVGRINGDAILTNYMLPIQFKPGKCQGEPGDLINNSTYFPNSNSVLDKAIPPPIGFERLDKSAEEVVTTALEKHNWKNSVLVVDVTASMAPYLAQTMKWLKKNMAKGNYSQAFFFNDGDGKMDYNKPLGNTGGIYQTDCSSFDQVRETLLKACNNGGDKSENNLEALLRAQEFCPKCESLVMIADNMATPRDMALLSQIRLPVHIILCASRFSPNPRYLDIAKATGGTVHTMSGESPDLKSLMEGQEVKIGVFTFRWKEGKFEKVLN